MWRRHWGRCLSGMPDCRYRNSCATLTQNSWQAPPCLDRSGLGDSSAPEQSPEVYRGPDVACCISINNRLLTSDPVDREETGQGLGSKTRWKRTKTGRERNTKQQRAISRQSDVMWVCASLVEAQQGRDRAPSLNLGVPPMLAAIPPLESLPPPSPVMSHTACGHTKLTLSFACELGYRQLCTLSPLLFSLWTLLLTAEGNTTRPTWQVFSLLVFSPNFLPSSILSVLPCLSSPKWQAPPNSFYLRLAPSNRGEPTRKKSEREDRFIGTDGGWRRWQETDLNMMAVKWNCAKLLILIYCRL